MSLDNGMLQSAKDLVSNMKSANSTPRFHPFALNKGKKRKSLTKPYMVEFIVYFFPGDIPLLKEYNIKVLKEAHIFHLSLTEECSEEYVFAEISRLLQKEIPALQLSSIKLLTFYNKIGRSNTLQKLVFGSLHKFDGVGIKTMCAKDKKRLHIILNKQVGRPYSIPARNTIPVENDGVDKYEL